MGKEYPAANQKLIYAGKWPGNCAATQFIVIVFVFLEFFLFFGD